MIGLTRQQRDCFLVIQELRDRHVAPTYDAILHELDLASRGKVARLVAALEERGWLRRVRAGGRLRLELLGAIAMPEEPEIVGLFDAPDLLDEMASHHRGAGP
jgi:SOS-response transcriptional repressor LexA